MAPRDLRLPSVYLTLAALLIVFVVVWGWRHATWKLWLALAWSGYLAHAALSALGRYPTQRGAGLFMFAVLVGIFLGFGWGVLGLLKLAGTTELTWVVGGDLGPHYP